MYYLQFAKLYCHNVFESSKQRRRDPHGSGIRRSKQSPAPKPTLEQSYRRLPRRSIPIQRLRFEALHALSLQYYQRDLCRFAYKLEINGGIKPEEEENELKILRNLLREYCE